MYKLHLKKIYILNPVGYFFRLIKCEEVIYFNSTKLTQIKNKISNYY